MVSGGFAAGNIQELRGLTSRKSIDQKGGAASGRVPRKLIYGDRQMPETQVKTGGI